MIQIFDKLSRTCSLAIRTLVRMNGVGSGVVMTRVPWRSRFARWLLAFGAVFSCYQAYALIVVPFVEPEMIEREASQRRDDLASSTPNRPELDQLFPPGAWERQNPMVLETDNGMLLFQDYETSDDGQMTLSPCTVVFFTPASGFSGDVDPAGGHSNTVDRKRPIILKAPYRAVLNFAGPLNLGRAEISRLRGARLEGEITISSPPSEPGADDELLIITRNVQILPKQIWTPHDVQFRYGPHRGSGRDLSINLSKSDKRRKRSSDESMGESLVGSVESLELVHVDKLTLQLPKKNLFDQPGLQAKGPVQQAAVSNPARSDAVVEITCNGSFHFDFLKGVASLEDHVNVSRFTSLGQEDQLSCQQLLIHFDMTGRRKSVGKTQDEAGTSAISMAPQRLVAIGLPAVVNAPSMEIAAHGRRIEYDVVSQRILLKDQQTAEFCYRKNCVRSTKLEYQIHAEPRRLGKLWASGPGFFQGQSDAKEGQSVEVTWNGELRLQEQEGLHVLSVVDGASILVAGPATNGPPGAGPGEGMTGRFSANRLFLWLAEVPIVVEQPRTPDAQGPSRLPLTSESTPSNGGGLSLSGPTVLQNASDPQTAVTSSVLPADTVVDAKASQRYELRPEKMLADGDVKVDSPQMTGDARRLEIWFHHPSQAKRRRRSAQAAGRPKQVPRSEETEQEESAFAWDANDTRQLEFHGGLVRLDIMMAKKGPQIREANITDDVRLTQRETPGGPESLMVSGQTLQLRTDALKRVNIDINGSPARVFAQEMLLEGGSLHLSQRENRLWTEGPGRMKLPSRREKSDPLKTTAPSWVNWQRGMDFNGQLARFVGQVEIRGMNTLENGDTMHLLAAGEQLHAQMNRYVEFQRAGDTAGLDVVEIRFPGDVIVENQTFSHGGSLKSHEYMKMRDFVLDRTNGQFRGLGPGSIVSHHIDDGSYRKSFIGSDSATRQLPAKTDRQLNYLRVDFDHAVTGNIERREVEFGDLVGTVYGPIESWSGALDPDVPGGLGPEGISLTCQRLNVAQLGQGEMKSVELKAVGNTYVEAEQFSARGDRLSYSANKEQLILEGIGRNFAVLEQRGLPGQRPSASSVKKIIYYPRTGQMDVEGCRSIDYTHFGSPTARSRNVPNSSPTRPIR